MKRERRGAIQRRTLLPGFRTDFSLIYAFPGPEKNESRRYNAAATRKKPRKRRPLFWGAPNLRYPMPRQ